MISMLVLVDVQCSCMHIKLPPMQRLNLELDLQSLFGLHVHSCAHWRKPSYYPHPPPFPPFGLIYEADVGQPR
jgi:hypothetical protein